MSEICSSIAMTRSRLPPLASLRAFEAAARFGSFREAAREQGVTPSAISHQVRQLEADLGVVLFQRAVRAVRLTAAGEALARDASDAFDRLGASVSRLRAQEGGARLRISALPLITDAWLTPRLEDFQKRYPDLSLEIETSNRVADLYTEDVDLAIRNIYAPDPGLKCYKLIDLHALPVCAPEIAARLNAPADLAKETLIHISSRKAGWPDWLASAGVPGMKPRSHLAFDSVPSALEAAAQGRGITLGVLPLLWEAPTARGLVLPFSGPRLSAGTYYLVHRKEDAARPAVAAFAQWMTAAMRGDKRRLERINRQQLPPAPVR
jgi:LysR family glycine cleavage system transcriptional activator